MWLLAMPHLWGTGVWFDLMGQYHGSLVGAAWAESPLHAGGWGALSVAGGTRIDGPPQPIPPSITLALWVNLVVTTGVQILAINRTGNAEVSGSTWFVNSGTLEFWSDNGAGTWNASLHAGSATAGRWTRLLGTYDAASGTANSYINGVNTSTTTIAAGPLHWATGAGEQWHIGSDNSGNGADAALDDFSIWGRAMSAAEAKADYDLSRRGYPGVLNFRPTRGYAAASPPPPPPSVTQYLPLLGCGS